MEQNERNSGWDMYWWNDLSSELEGAVTVDLMKAADRQEDRYIAIQRIDEE